MQEEVRSIMDAHQPLSGRRDMQGTGRQGWFVDAHVHYHDEFDAARFIGAAFGNVMAAAAASDVEATGCMVLTDAAGRNAFARLLSRRLERWPADLQVHATQEPESALLINGRGEAIVAVAGRQIVTAERLEVLALGTTRTFADGRPINDTLERVTECGAVPVVPWGFGKWLLSRGRLLRRLLDAEVPPTFHLGDNGGRLRHAPASRLFARAQRRSVWNLPGSDPLPFPWQAERVLSYGFFLPCAPDLDAPWTQIRSLIAAARSQPELLGRRESAAHFARTQVALRVRHTAR
jgi:hypothetical protein